MVESEGDIIRPRELILPDMTNVGAAPLTSGALYMSGAKLIYCSGSTPVIVGEA